VPWCPSQDAEAMDPHPIGSVQRHSDVNKNIFARLRQSLRWKPSITSAVSCMMLCHCVIITKLQEHSETTNLSECKCVNVNVN